MDMIWIQENRRIRAGGFSSKPMLANGVSLHHSLYDSQDGFFASTVDKSEPDRGRCPRGTPGFPRRQGFLADDRFGLKLVRRKASCIAIAVGTMNESDPEHYRISPAAER